MKVKKFDYKKKKDNNVNSYLLLMLDENETHIGGIDFTKLEDEEIRHVIRIQSEYELKLKPFIKKSYRKYIKENIIDDNTIIDPKQLSDIK